MVVDSEDVDNFGICDPAEDTNSDGVLTPGNVASYTVEGLTNASGVAVLNIVYPKSFAQWAQMQLEVTAAVGGTEGKNAMTIPLPILAADVSGSERRAAEHPAARAAAWSTASAGFMFSAPSGEEVTLGLRRARHGGRREPFPYWSAGSSRRPAGRSRSVTGSFNLIP